MRYIMQRHLKGIFEQNDNNYPDLSGFEKLKGHRVNFEALNTKF
jgi:hypothetical protein